MEGVDTMGMLNSVWPCILMIGIFYFMLYKPQKKEQQKREALLNGLKEGDKVITIGGIYGTITGLTEKRIKLQIAEGVEIEMSRTAVSGIQAGTAVK